MLYNYDCMIENDFNEINVINLLEQVLGKGQVSYNKKQIKFYCPFCNHYKQKLEINIDHHKREYQYWNCWVCSNKNNAKGNSIYSLFKKLNVTGILLETAKRIKPTGKYYTSNNSEENNNEIQLSLPKEFNSLIIKPTETNIEYNTAINYLKGRTIKYNDILKYNLGYCTSGEYAHMIIIPSYDETGKLNFFTGRAYRKGKINHLCPSIPKDNIIGFENTINWKIPITIVEGGFDAMVLKRNVIPLFGKVINDKLKIKIIKKKVSRVNIVLDPDAIIDSFPVIEFLLSEGIEPVLFPLEEDPAKTGYENLINFYKNKNTMIISKLNLLKIKREMYNKQIERDNAKYHYDKAPF